MSSGARVPDYQGAICTALDLLRAHLPGAYTYHNVAHTEFDVLPAAQRLARLNDLSAREALILQVAAAFHDLGYIRSTENHEAIGIEIMNERLPALGFGDMELAEIASVIEATRMPQKPANTLGEMLADADLDSLGRDDFIQTSYTLWLEQTAIGRGCTWEEWLLKQVQFLEGHHYFTSAARALRDTGKKNNIALLKRLLGEQISEMNSQKIGG